VFAEKIDDRRAEQGEARGVDEVRELGRRAVEQHDDFDLATVHPRKALGQTSQREEPEPGWAREVFVQQVVPVKFRPRQRQEILVGAQAFVLHGVFGDRHGWTARCSKLTGRANHGGDCPDMQQLEQVRGDLLITGQIDGETVEPLQVRDPDVTGCREPQPQGAAHLRIGWDISRESRNVWRNAG